eukprot:CAMPEP_0177613374 /NCGR_PEP_ID=MMETSP0419_2-20121207/21916_1 /TAXON_ID=582737 /ORGANISM="Tetraselmis sp., Strain GSL018" /LENGTH=272 /DNA_ID=CAMNT_0019110017 /DNA_START=304 /DNA_END=1119 /DNA_ORIENTATION=+
MRTALLLPGGVVMPRSPSSKKRIQSSDAVAPGGSRRNRRATVVHGGTGKQWPGQSPARAGRTELADTAQADAETDLLGSEDEAATKQQGEDPPGGWVSLVSLCTLSSIICTIDRAAMSVAIIPMAGEFAWTEQVKGAVSSAFFAGYTLTNFSGGYLTSVFPAASLLGAGVVLWSVFTVLTPAAAVSRSMPTLLGCRAAMGVSEGVAFPSYTSLYATHIPKERRSLAQALLYTGQQLGTIIALLASPKVIEWGGWHAVFYLFGSLGLLWAFAW